MAMTYRFSVYDSVRNTLSATWKCHIRRADVYIFCRSIAYAMKVSLHTATGQRHLKYSPSFAEINAEVLTGPYIDKWTYIMNGGWVSPLRIITPPDAVNMTHDISSFSNRIFLIPKCTDNYASFVRLVITAPETRIEG